MCLKDDDFRRIGGFRRHVYSQITRLVDFGFQSFLIRPRDEEIPDLLFLLARSWILSDFVEICEGFGHGNGVRKNMWGVYLKWWKMEGESGEKRSGCK